MVIGKKHNYAGMELDYSSPGEVIVSMDSYITEAIDGFLEEMTQKIQMLEGNHFFKVDDTCAKLFERNKIIFHRLVEKLIFLRKHVRPNIHPKIALLTTRLRNPDEDDWKNIRRVLSYLNARINSIKLHLNADNLNVVHWWVDASYGTHPDLKGQKHLTVSIGEGCVTSA